MYFNILCLTGRYSVQQAVFEREMPYFCMKCRFEYLVHEMPIPMLCEVQTEGVSCFVLRFVLDITHKELYNSDVKFIRREIP